MLYVGVFFISDGKGERGILLVMNIKYTKILTIIISLLHILLGENIVEFSIKIFFSSIKYSLLVC